MGGGNAQKSAIARLRNQKNAGQTDEERKASSDKAKKDACGFICKNCRTTFMINVKPPTLYLHVTSKHPAGTDPASCFDALIGFDPEDPKGLKKAAADKEAANKPKPKKTKKKGGGPDDGLDLLSAGLTKGKGKKK
jgi:hypothetical protein